MKHHEEPMKKSRVTKSVSNVVAVEAPKDAEMLDFLLEIMRWPFKSYLSGPDTARGEQSAYFCSYDHDGDKELSDTSYAPTLKGAVAKAMKVLVAQRKAKKIVEDAKK